MSRAPATIRPADDLSDAEWAAVQAMWDPAVDALPLGVDARLLTPERIRHALTGPGVTALVAEHDGRPVGAVVVSTHPLSALLNDGGMTIDILYVAPAFRGRGIGSQLLAKAAAVAESLGGTTIACTAPASLRSANRFYARLGFGAPVTRRVVPIAALRRRLRGDAAGGVDRLLARRRSIRARAAERVEERVEVGAGR